MNFSMWTNYLRDTSPEEATALFAAKGWYNLELSTEHGEALLAREGEPIEIGAKFKAEADRCGVRFPQGHLWLQVDITEDGGVDVIKRWLDLYYGVGVRACVLHAGGKRLRENPEAREAANVKALKALCAHIAGRDQYICLENLMESCQRVSDLRRLIDMVGSPQLKICLDTGHLHVSKGDLAEFITEAGPLLKALHIADNEGERDQHMMPYGRGGIRWEGLFAALAEVGYDGLFNYEIPGESFAPHEILMAKLDYLRAVSAYMIGKIEAR